MSDKPREWFAVKRAKKSSYQFYEPNPGNRKTIEAIAPDGGNFEVTCLIEKSAYDRLASENGKFVMALRSIASGWECSACSCDCHSIARKVLENE